MIHRDAAPARGGAGRRSRRACTATSTPSTASSSSPDANVDSFRGATSVEEVVTSRGSRSRRTWWSSASARAPHRARRSRPGCRATGSRSTQHLRTSDDQRLRGGRRRRRPSPALRHAPPGRALGQRTATKVSSWAGTSPVVTRSTTGFRTSSPTNTTSGWSTSDTRRVGPRRGARRARPTASSSPSGSRTTRVVAAMNVNVWDVVEPIQPPDPDPHTDRRRPPPRPRRRARRRRRGIDVAKRR